MNTDYIQYKMKGVRIDNIPKTGMLTGRYEIDTYGCWWEVTTDDGTKNFWMIGDYPNRED